MILRNHISKLEERTKYPNKEGQTTFIKDLLYNIKQSKTTAAKHDTQEQPCSHDDQHISKRHPSYYFYRWAHSEIEKISFHVYYNTNGCAHNTKFVCVLIKFGSSGKHPTKQTQILLQL
jgi:hypothetical protein